MGSIARGNHHHHSQNRSRTFRSLDLEPIIPSSQMKFLSIKSSLEHWENKLSWRIIFFKLIFSSSSNFSSYKAANPIWQELISSIRNVVDFFSLFNFTVHSQFKSVKNWQIIFIKHTLAEKAVISTVKSVVLTDYIVSWNYWFSVNGSNWFVY